MSRFNKFNAVKVKGCPHCGRTHDSKAEARECEYLHILMRGGEDNITHIDVHPTVTLHGNIRWVLDFCIWHEKTLHFVDVKGILTPDFILKRKLFNAYHPAAPLVCVRWQGKKRIVMEQEAKG